MASDISIANLPAFVGVGAASTDLVPFVDVSDLTESPLGTTKRMTLAQAGGGIAALTAPVTITGPAPVLTLNANPAPNLPGITIQRAGVQWGGIQWIAPSVMQIFDNGSAQVALLTSGNLKLNGTVEADGPNAFSIGVVLGQPRIQFGSDSATSFSPLLAGGGAADLFAGQGNFSASPAMKLHSTPGGAYAALWIMNGSGGVAQLNWEISKSNTTANALQFTPSTANDGTTFSAPVATLSNLGTLNLAGQINAIGNSSFTGDVATGNAAFFQTATAGVGPIVRWIRTAPTARTWQMRLNVAGGFEFVDESAGARCARKFSRAVCSSTTRASTSWPVA